jgi:UPF0042 nucleotide-binding protein
VRLLEPLLELEAKLNPTRSRLALGMDNRQEGFATDFAPMMERLRRDGISICILFVDSDDQVLLRRFSESRRPHYLAGESDNVTEAITKERALLAPVRALASAILDTSSLNLSQLRQRIGELLPDLPLRETTLRLISFGFKYGIPEDADMVLDARFLPNPHYVPELKPLTGKDQPVRDYLLKSEAFTTFLGKVEHWILWAWPLILQEGRAYHTVAIGCTGGQHRSVALVEMLSRRLDSEISKIVVSHRELKGS